MVYVYVIFDKDRKSCGDPYFLKKDAVFAKRAMAKKFGPYTIQRAKLLVEWKE